MKGGNTMAKFDYKKLTAQEIYEYMEAHATAEQKAEFMKVAFPEKQERKAQVLRDTNGNILRQVAKDKNGNPKLNKDGSPVMIEQKKMVIVADSEAKKAYNHFEAKKWFADTFRDAVDNAPNPGKKKETVSSMFNW